jgi:plastocyanin
MAKKIVKKTVKKTPYRHSHHHHTETNNLVLILGGGFIVLVILMFMVMSTSSMMTHPSVTDAQVPVQEVKNTNAVMISNYAYAPETITVKVGDTVTFTNNDSVAHTVTADDSSFDTGNIAQGESKTVTFDKAGTFSYHCTNHSNMTGTVVVEE